MIDPSKELALHHPSLPEWMGEELTARGLSWEALIAGRLWADESFPFTSLAEFKQFVIFDDPVRYAECCLVDTDLSGNPPWQVWHFQAATLRLECNMLIHSAPETGKTRDIFVRSSYLALTRLSVNQLIAGALDSHSMKIFRMYRKQATVNPWFNRQIDWKATKQSPYVDLELRNGNTISFRPGGTDGTALRGEHVVAAYFDEAPMSRGEEVKKNLLSRVKRNGTVRIYGTPGDDQSGWFYDMCQGIPEEDPLDPRLPFGSHGPDGPFIRIRWPLHLSPEWTQEREESALRKWGGRDSSGYQQQVLGKFGDPTSSVFPWFVFSRGLKFIEEYRLLQFTYDEESGIHLDGYHLSPDYKVGRPGDKKREASGSGPLIRFCDEELPISLTEPDDKELRVVRWSDFLRRVLIPLDGPLVAGVDFGSSLKDPTEILFAQPIGERRRWLLRCQLKNFDYEMIVDVLYALAAVIEPAFGWGLEATAIGKAVVGFLKREVAGISIDFTRCPMNAATPELDTYGNPVKEEDGRAAKVSYKELGTRLLEFAMQRELVEIPWDPDMMVQFPAHTSTGVGLNGRKFKKKNDHIIEAARVLELRLYFLRYGKQAVPGDMRYKLSGKPSASHRLAADLQPAGSSAFGTVGNLRGLFE